MYSNCREDSFYAVYNSSRVSMPATEGVNNRQAHSQRKTRTELLAHGLQLVQVCLVLLLVLHLLPDALKDAHGSRVVIDASRGAQSSFNDGGRGHEIVREAVVQATLDLEQVLRGREEIDVAFVEGFECLLAVRTGRGAGEDWCRPECDGASAEQRGEHASADHDDCFVGALLDVLDSEERVSERRREEVESERKACGERRKEGNGRACRELRPRMLPHRSLPDVKRSEHGW